MFKRMGDFSKAITFFLIAFALCFGVVLAARL